MLVGGGPYARGLGSAPAPIAGLDARKPKMPLPDPARWCL
jgi:hypothetical protein